jgi:hypothetical protein
MMYGCMWHMMCTQVALYNSATEQMRLTLVAERARSAQCVVLSTNRKYWASIETLEDSSAQGA